MHWILPHDGKYQPQKPDKLRPVFKAAAKYNDCSLNDNLSAGLYLLRNLPGSLFRFNSNLVAPRAEIVSMCLQTLVPGRDCGCLGFVNEDDKTSKLSTFWHNCHIFEPNIAPICAKFAFKKRIKS